MPTHSRYARTDKPASTSWGKARRCSCALSFVVPPGLNVVCRTSGSIFSASDSPLSTSWGVLQTNEQDPREHLEVGSSNIANRAPSLLRVCAVVSFVPTAVVQSRIPQCTVCAMPWPHNFPASQSHLERGYRVDGARSETYSSADSVVETDHAIDN